MLPVWLELREGGPNEPATWAGIGPTPFDFLRAWFPSFEVVTGDQKSPLSVDTQLDWKKEIVDGLLTLYGRYGSEAFGVEFFQVNPADPKAPNHNRLVTYGLPGADLVWEYRLGPLLDNESRCAYRNGRLVVRMTRERRAELEETWKRLFARDPVFGLARQPRPETPSTDEERLAIDVANLDAALRECFPEAAETILLRYAGVIDDPPSLDHARESVERALQERHPDLSEEMLVRLERARAAV